MKLPTQVRALLCDLDGVLTDTATLHAQAWAAVFDAYLRETAQRTGTAFVPFDPVADYRAHVDGRRRADGVRAFLASRGLTLPDGAVDDPPDRSTVHGLGNRKAADLRRRIRAGGIPVYPDGRRLLQAARRAGLRTAVVSSSADAAEILTVAGLADLVDVRVDGVTARDHGLPGKPAPDTFLAAATELGVGPDQAVVLEDALPGVQAGRAGRFALVIGVDRSGQAAALRAHGADVVVQELDALELDALDLGDPDLGDPA